MTFLEDPRSRVLAAAVLAFALSFAAIGAAWGFELIGGYAPCPLCLAQRLPYYVAMPVGAFAILFATWRWTLLARLLLLVVAAAMLYTGGLGVYQAGAEWGVWAGPVDCGGAGARVENAGTMLDVLAKTRVTSCVEASFRFLGLSFAGWNVVAALAIFLVAMAGALARRRREPRPAGGRLGAEHGAR